MNSQFFMFVDPPKLSDDAASEVLDFLHELIHAYENHYRHQLRRHYEANVRAIIDPFENEFPPF